MLLMIDNYDSFTFNIVQYLRELGEDVRVYRNDEINTAEIQQLSPDMIVISPGPCTPNEAGISMEVVQAFEGAIPILGICLGHQSLSQVYGGNIIKAGQVMHGKTSLIHHTGQNVFAGLTNPFTATRYHSLVVEKESLPDCLEVIAWTENDDGELGEIMAVRHRQFAITGVQFHPESILTEHGHELLGNFLNLAKGKN
ncbi:MAG: aminodeoxychorismate/anthranilate synthase component II [Gammaproteobacteria bacterium]|jgi:anthranilate synthase component II|nr:aminodeoxychorismate/anthranilate synthase component II [Gammaproteobacteria bacterium]MBT6587213.1 aminodeoxychorismate/anthranilate synthase component II [Gammaproteobacteria bacterium]